MRRSPFRCCGALSLALALVTVSSASAAAQSSALSQQGAADKKDPKSLKVLTLADYGRWNRITSTNISADGKWMTYVYQPNDGDATLYVKQLDGDKVYTIPIGTTPAPAGGGGGGFGAAAANGPVFSDDSRWVGYYVNPPA